MLIDPIEGTAASGGSDTADEPAALTWGTGSDPSWDISLFSTDTARLSRARSAVAAAIAAASDGA